jgi:hypothetical protein
LRYCCPDVSAGRNKPDSVSRKQEKILDKRVRLKLNDEIINILTAVVLAIVLIIIILSLIIFQNPVNPLNPFPPPTMPAALVLPSATVTSSFIPAIPTIEQTVTPMHTSTSTDLPVSTATSTSFPTPTQTATPATGYRYQIQGNPVAINASVFNNDRQDCSWMGVAGQVHDMQERPVTGILVLLGGQLEGNNLNQIMMTGTALNYGPAGYEFELADHVAASTGRIWIQLVDQSYIPLSAKIYFDTYADDDCGRNLTIINFKQVR